MAKMVVAQDLKSCGKSRPGSSPGERTTISWFNSLSKESRDALFEMYPPPYTEDELEDLVMAHSSMVEPSDSNYGPVA